MTWWAWSLLGGFAASVFWMFAVAWLLDVTAAQRTALNSALATVRLYRETRDHSDGQVRALLDHNERLAHQLLEAQASWPVVAIPQSFFHARRES